MGWFWVLRICESLGHLGPIIYTPDRFSIYVTFNSWKWVLDLKWTILIDHVQLQTTALAIPGTEKLSFQTTFMASTAYRLKMGLILVYNFKCAQLRSTEKSITTPFCKIKTRFKKISVSNFYDIPRPTTECKRLKRIQAHC